LNYSIEKIACLGKGGTYMFFASSIIDYKLRLLEARRAKCKLYFSNLTELLDSAVRKTLLPCKVQILLHFSSSNKTASITFKFLALTLT
jgi:hypothetical protein